MNTKIFEVKCITNLHIGTSGSAYGVIKNEVEKDVVLNTPLLPASGIKGALRDFWRQNNKKYQEKIFGSDPSEQNEGSKGKCKFLNGQMILRPMRVSLGDYSYCLVTTPDLIRTMLDTFRDFGVKTYRGISTNVLDKEDFLKNIFNEIDVVGKVYYKGGTIKEIEGYSVSSYNIENSESKDVISGIFTMLSYIAQGVPVAIMKSEVFQMIDLPIVARNHLIDGKSNNLWYEELVPHQSRFYFITLWEGNDGDNIYKYIIDEIPKIPISFGGNNSIGNGYCSIKIVEEKNEETNDGEQKEN
jgi:CRISPR-associated RAMP protein, cmr4 family